jgi:uncharacterized membrane protein YvbJ
MFCPACGGQFEGRLNYCKHCGASLTALNQATNRESAERSTETLGWVIVGTSITLLGMALGALVLIKDNAIDPSLGKVFVIMSLVGFVLVEAVLISRFVHLSRKANQPDTTRTSELSTKELGPASTPVLADRGEAISINEESTRDLESARRTKKSVS